MSWTSGASGSWCSSMSWSWQYFVTKCTQIPGMDVRTQQYTSSRCGSHGYVGITEPLVFQRKVSLHCFDCLRSCSKHVVGTDRMTNYFNNFCWKENFDLVSSCSVGELILTFIDHSHLKQTINRTGPCRHPMFYISQERSFLAVLGARNRMRVDKTFLKVLVLKGSNHDLLWSSNYMGSVYPMTM